MNKDPDILDGVDSAIESLENIRNAIVYLRVLLRDAHEEKMFYRNTLNELLQQIASGLSGSELRIYCAEISKRSI